MKIFTNLSYRIQKIFTVGPIREGGRNPHVDWAMVLITGVIVGICLVANGVYLFKRVTNGDIQGKQTPVSLSAEAFDVEGLNYIYNKFETKAESLKEVKRGYRTIDDPAI